MTCAMLSSVLPPALHSLREWTIGLRLSGVRLMHSLCQLAEGHMTRHLTAVLPALRSSVGDEDGAVVQWVIKAVHVLGACVKVRLLR